MDEITIFSDYRGEEIYKEIKRKYINAYWDVKCNPTEENQKTFEKVCFEVLEQLMIANQDVLKRLKRCGKYYEIDN